MGADPRASNDVDRALAFGKESAKLMLSVHPNTLCRRRGTSLKGGVARTSIVGRRQRAKSGPVDRPLEGAVA